MTTQDGRGYTYLATGLHERDVLRMAAVVNKEALLLHVLERVAHGHGFGGGSGFVEEGSVREGHT